MAVAQKKRGKKRGNFSRRPEQQEEAERQIVPRSFYTLLRISKEGTRRLAAYVYTHGHTHGHTHAQMRRRRKSISIQWRAETSSARPSVSGERSFFLFLSACTRPRARFSPVAYRLLSLSLCPSTRFPRRSSARPDRYCRYIVTILLLLSLSNGFDTPLCPGCH